MFPDDDLDSILGEELLAGTDQGPRPSDVARLRALAQARRDAASPHPAAQEQSNSQGRPRPRASPIASETTTNKRNGRWWRTLQLAAVAAGVAAIFAAGALVGSVRATSDGSDQAGTVEFRGVLTASQTGGQASDGQASVVGRLLSIGRVVSLQSDDLAILPVGQYYEVWFVGPGDSTDSPNRISAGTFHPDERGRSQVALTAAVDPTKYPTLVVTAELGDGDPAPSNREVLRGMVLT